MSIFIKTGYNLESHVNTTTFAMASYAWNKLNIGSPTLSICPPWAAALIVLATTADRSNVLARLGVEHVLRTRSSQDGKELFTLETADEALRALSQGPPSEQIALLEYATKAETPILKELHSMAEGWRVGDEEVFERILDQRLSLGHVDG